MKISAAVVRETGGPFSIEELELDDPRAGEVLVKVVGAGMCHTDLVTRDGGLPPAPPCVPGHEGAGIVERVGPGVTKVEPGDHVVMTFTSCSRCVSCQRGKPAYCLEFVPYNFGGARPDGSSAIHLNGDVISGHYFGQSSMATYAVASERNVVKIADDVPIEVLGPLGCGVQTGAGAVMNSLHPLPGSSLAIFGVGSVGMSAVMGAVVTGCTTIIAVDPNPDRLALARDFGATHTLNPRELDPVEAIRKVTGGGGADYSLEMSGHPSVLRQAVDCLALLGTCGIIGVPPAGSEVGLDIFSLLFGRFVRGIVEGDSVPDIFIPTMVELYRQGRFPFDRMIRFYDLDQVNEAAQDSEKGLTMKPVLKV